MTNIFKNESSNKQFPYKSYMNVHLNVRKQVTAVKLTVRVT